METRLAFSDPHSTHTSTFRRDTLAATASILINNTWTNDTIHVMCLQLQSDTKTLHFGSTTTNQSVWYTMPDCFYSSLSELVSVTFYQAIFFGNSTYPDPLARLAASYPLLKSIRFTNCRLINDGGTTYDAGLEIFFENWPTASTISSTRTHIGGMLPTTLPSTVSYLALPQSGISGTLPPAFFDNHSGTSLTTLFCDLSNNGLNGTLPPAWASSLPMTNLASISIYLRDNQFSGTMPSDFFGNHNLSALFHFEFDLSSNNLTGSPGEWIPNFRANFGVFNVLYLNLSHNSFAGQLSSSWFPTGFASASNCRLDLSNNQLSGTIPANLLSSTRFVPQPLMLSLDFSHNALQGDVPSTLLSLPSGPAENISSSFASPRLFRLLLAGNQLDGTINNAIFRSFNWSFTELHEFCLENNLLTGNLPDTLFANFAAENLIFLVFNITNNRLDGSIPASFFDSFNPSQGLYPYPPSRLTSPWKITIHLDSNRLTGTLKIPDFAEHLAKQPLSLFLSVADNTLSTLDLDPEAYLGLSSLNISNNFNLTGSIATSFFSATAKLELLYASNTSIYGQFPALAEDGAPSLNYIALDNTMINFCNTPRSNWTSSTLSFCSLLGTTAFECPYAYPSVCVSSAPPPRAVSVPAAPVCAESTRPSPSFVCINGTWTSTTSVTIPTLVIPSGSTLVQINGNLTSAQIIIQGFGSTVTITGCSENLTSIIIELTQEDLEKIRKNQKQNLLSMNSNCTELAKIDLNTKVIGSGCRQLKVEKIVSGGTISGLFMVDASRCNRGWIIAVSVVCSIVLVAVIVIAVVVACCCKQKTYAQVVKSKQGP